VTRGRRWLIGSSIAAVLTVATITVLLRIPFSSEILSERVTETLADRLNAEVELGSLTLRAFPTIHAVGTGLKIRHKGRTDVPPLIAVESFTVHGSLMSAWRRRVDRVRLEGLEIQIPPDDEHDEPDESDAVAITGTHLVKGRQVIVDELIADAAKLVIIPRNRAKQHRTWVMHTLRVRNVSVNTEMPFETTLTNAVPPGTIITEGSFGPWHRDDPGHTPIHGRFTFKDADLSVFKGISGTLQSTGTYSGILERLNARGETDVPNFKVEVGGHEVPLHAKYDAVIDGTNGDTRLDRVDATFLDTSLTATGGVFDVEGVPGREVRMAVVMERGRLEDVMALAVNTAKPPMTGGLALKAKFVIPAGEQDVVDKLKLDGTFAINGGRFTDAGVQQKINDMSRRARGEIGKAKADPVAPRVASDFQGRFALNDGVLRLPTLVFDIPGAAVRLQGTYSLRRERINFAGNLYMDAKISQTVTGWKSMLLKLADPFFREKGQTVVPVKITGSREAPSFGMDVGRIFGKGD
jgi:hypothetical protein